MEKKLLCCIKAKAYREAIKTNVCWWFKFIVKFMCGGTPLLPRCTVSGLQVSG